MANFPVPVGVIVLTTYSHKGGVPRDPQPVTLTEEEAGNGVVGQWPDGTEQHIPAPVPEPSVDHRRCTEIDAELADLDAKLDRRGEDLWSALASLGASISPFVQEVRERKEKLRAERAQLNLD